MRPSHRLLVSLIATVSLLAACAAPIDEQTDPTTAPTTEESTVTSSPNTSSDETTDETTESTQPEIPVTTTQPEKKNGLPVPPDPTIPPPRD
jgi:hypothetical protein